ncbi:DnaT-like ssDNA-binding domain-containing protein [Pseudomonas luteola]|nr:DnaT-like ssDNA-binding domain-containing protein [Pseudomonas luteola]
MQLNEKAGPAVAVYPAFRKVLGLNATAAQFLSQAVYWTERTTDGWFYKTNSEWMDEIGLTVEEVKGARKKLKAMGVLAEDRRGVPAKMFYKVDQDLLLAILSGEKPLTSQGETLDPVSGKPSNCSGENPLTITKNTQEITTSSTQGADVVSLFAASEYQPMTLGWQPDDKILKAYAFAQGVNLSLITQEILAGFTCHFASHPEICDTLAGWTNRLVKWAKTERVLTETGKPAKPEPASNVPVDKIIALYHRVCPNLPQVTVPDDPALHSMIAERWNESKDHQSGNDFWKPFFQKANRLNEVFYRGRNCVPYLEAIVSRAVFRQIEVMPA